MTNIERIESSGNALKSSEDFADKIELMETVDARKLFKNLPESTQNNFMENFTVFDNENNVIDFYEEPFIIKTKPLDPEIVDMVNDNFWELLEDQIKPTNYKG